MKRRIIAELILDESVMCRNMETNGIEDTGDIDYVVGEINEWCGQSGISVANARIIDEDDKEDKRLIELADSVFSVVVGDIVLDRDELIDHDSGYNTIKVDKDIFDDFVPNSYIEVAFSDDEHNFITYIMTDETDEYIEMEIMGQTNMLKIRDKFVNVEVGDTCTCFDEYSHDYEEHTVKVRG